MNKEIFDILADREIGELIDLPELDDPVKKVIIDGYVQAWVAAYFNSNHDLAAFLVRAMSFC